MHKGRTEPHMDLAFTYNRQCYRQIHSRSCMGNACTKVYAHTALLWWYCDDDSHHAVIPSFEFGPSHQENTWASTSTVFTSILFYQHTFLCEDDSRYASMDCGWHSVSYILLSQWNNIFTAKSNIPWWYRDMETTLSTVRSFERVTH